ncbi:hypothetical protein NDI48_26950 [Microcoleus sp. AS-A8]
MNKPSLETQQYLQQFFEKDAETIKNWDERCVQRSSQSTIWIRRIES